MKCPICETHIQNLDSNKCTQCDSDLEVFKTLGQLKVETKTHSKASVPMLEKTVPEQSKSVRSINWIVLISIVVFFLAILVLIYQMQSKMLSELNLERAGRQQSEERNAKITEKFIEKTTESFSNAIQTMVKENQDQRDSIEHLNEKLYELEEKAKQLEQSTKLKSMGPGKKDPISKKAIKSKEE
jgi:Ni,Fe-hydrogenase I large subunit